MVVLEALTALKGKSLACADHREGGQTGFLTCDEGGDVYAKEVGAVVQEGEGKIGFTVFTADIGFFGYVNNRSNLSCRFACNQS